MLNTNCFLISAIGDENSPERINSDRVIKNLIKPVMSSIGFNVIRADNITGSSNILTDIVKHLDQDEIVIADISYNNPNVFFEIGYRYCSNLHKDEDKMPILIRNKESNFKPPFDISNFRYIEYELKVDTIDTEKERLLEYTGYIKLPNNLKTLYDAYGKDYKVIFIPNEDSE